MINFYTYLWLREDGTPYYVGKGSGKRAIRKSSPKDLTRILIQPHPSEQDSFAAESFLISYYGRKDLGTGILRNRTNGGEGQSGRVYRASPETRRRNSAVLIGNSRKTGKKQHSEEDKRRLSLRLTGNSWNIGRTPWNKGRKETRSEVLSKMKSSAASRPRTRVLSMSPRAIKMRAIRAGLLRSGGWAVHLIKKDWN